MKFVTRPLLAVAVVAACATAWAAGPENKWLRVSDYDKALEEAGKKNQPIVVLHQSENSTCPLHNGMVQSTMMIPAVQGMVKVQAFVTDDKPMLKAARNVEGTYGMIPEIYFFSPSGELIAFVDYKDRGEAGKVAALVSDVTKWQAKARKQIEGADEAAGQGRYTAALKTLSEIEAADSKATAAMKGLLLMKSSDASPESGSAPGSKGSEKPSPAPAVKVENKPKAPEPGKYFAAVIAEKRTAYEGLANERVSKAKDLAGTKNFVEARKILTPLINDRPNYAALAEATALMKQMQLDEAAAKKATSAVQKVGG